MAILDILKNLDAIAISEDAVKVEQLHNVELSKKNKQLLSAAPRFL